MAFEFRLPDIGEGLVEGEIVKWLVGDGDWLSEDQPMVEVMTDKATVELPSPVEGRVVSRHGGEGEIVKVGDVLIVIQPETGKPQVLHSKLQTPNSKLQTSEPPSAAEPPEASGELEDGPPPPASVSPSPGAGASAAPGGKVLATPAVRRLAREWGIDLARVPSSGPGGRVTRSDLEGFRDGRQAAAARPASSVSAPSKVGEAPLTIPYRAFRKKIGDRMALSKRTAAHFTYVEECDATALVELRKEFGRLPQGRDVRLTYLPFIVKAVIRGLKQFPVVNSSLDEEAGEIRLKRVYNIGIATNAEQGLIVPVVKNADQKGILELAHEIAELAEAARANRSRLEDLRDGTFTITSLGPIGGLMATPIINHPEVAIMGIHKIAARPVVRDAQIVIRQMMNLSVSMDHRIVDGATGAEFLNYVIRFVENPGLLLID